MHYVDDLISRVHVFFAEFSRNMSTTFLLSALCNIFAIFSVLKRHSVIPFAQTMDCVIWLVFAVWYFVLHTSIQNQYDVLCVICHNMISQLDTYILIFQKRSLAIPLICCDASKDAICYLTFGDLHINLIWLFWNSDAFNLVVNNGEAAGQVIFHVSNNISNLKCTSSILYVMVFYYYSMLTSIWFLCICL